MRKSGALGFYNLEAQVFVWGRAVSGIMYLIYIVGSGVSGVSPDFGSKKSGAVADWFQACRFDPKSGENFC